MGPIRRDADYKSAIRQIENLRYGNRIRQQPPVPNHHQALRDRECVRPLVRYRDFGPDVAGPTEFVD